MSTPRTGLIHGVKLPRQLAVVFAAALVLSLSLMLQGPAPAHATFVQIEIETFTNGQDASSGLGPEVSLCSRVVWTYHVTIPSANGVPLTGVLVRDDNGTPANAADNFTPASSGGDDGDGTLEYGETRVYQAFDDTPQLGRYGNKATVRARSVSDRTVAQAQYTSRYVGVPCP